LLSPVFLMDSIPPNPGLAFEPLVGDGSLSLAAGARPLGVQVSASVIGVELRASLDGVVPVVAIDCLRGEGDAGLSGRRKGDARGEP
jgi:hypothetical protein